MSEGQPIGFFDSGVGGTSIWKEVINLLPNEHTIYLADSKNAPYGNKSKQEIIDLSVKNTEKLIKLGAKLIIVACNTATTNAIKHLRSSYSLPFIGIEPAIKPAAIQSLTKNVGVLATKGTLTSELFANTSNKYAWDIKIIEVIGTGLVELVETGDLENPELEKLVKKYTSEFAKQPIDHLVLGCTHYPYLVPLIKKHLPDHVKIIDSGEAVARQTKAVLAQNQLLHSKALKGKHQFYSNQNCKALKDLVSTESPLISFTEEDF